MTETSIEMTETKINKKMAEAKIDKRMVEFKIDTVCDGLKDPNSFSKFAESTSLHGLGRIVQTKTKAGKTLWAALIVGFLIFLAVMLTNVFGSYLSNKSYITREKRQVENMTFPSVAFCPTALLRKSGMKTSDSKFIDHVFQLYSEFEHKININKVRVANLLMRSELLEGYTGMRNATANADTLFIAKMNSACRFGLDTPCHYPLQFEELPVSLFEGVCFRFNPNGTFAQVGEGSYYGLSIILFLNQSDTSPYSGFDVGSGVQLVIQTPGAFPFPLENGILATTGAYTRIILEKRAFKRLPPPYPSQCVDNGETIYPGKYTTRNCKRSCFVRYAGKACGGTDAFVEYYTGHKRVPPLNQSELMCFYDKQIEAAWPQNMKHCQCGLQCYEETFLPMLSQSKWPSKVDLPHYKKIFAASLGLDHSKMTDEFVYNNFLKVNIFFSELAYEFVEEMPEWTKQKLISDIGGQMGIWIGASLFSVLELIIFLIYLAKGKFHQWMEKSSNKVSSTKVQSFVG
eukprot:gene5683-6384_t